MISTFNPHLLPTSQEAIPIPLVDLSHVQLHCVGLVIYTGVWMIGIYAPGQLVLKDGIVDMEFDFPFGRESALGMFAGASSGDADGNEYVSVILRPLGSRRARHG